MEICILVDRLNRRFLNHYFPQSGDSLGHASHPDELSNETSFPISFFYLCLAMLTLMLLLLWVKKKNVNEENLYHF